MAGVFIKRVIPGVLILTALVPVAGYIALSTMDLGRFTAQLQRVVREKTGRELTIDGEIRASLGLTPTLTVKKVALSNPSWAKHKQLIAAESLTVKLDLLPLFKREIAIGSIEADGARIALEKSENGAASWAFSPQKEKQPATPQDAEAQPERATSFTTRIGLVTLRDTQISYRDHARGKEVAATLPALTLDTQNAFRLKAQLALEDFSGTLELEGESLAQLAQRPLSVALDMRGTGGGRLLAHGTVEDLTGEPRFTLTSEMAAESLAAFSGVAGSALPETQALEASLTLNGTAKEIAFDALKASLGKTSLTGHGRLRLSGDVPNISASLDIPSYVPEHAATPSTPGAASVTPQPTSGDKRILPDIAFPAGALSALNADIEFTIGKVEAARYPVEAVMGHLVLKQGILQVDPFQFKLGKEQVRGNLAYNPTVAPPAMSITMTTGGEDLGAFLRALNLTEKVTGGRFTLDMALKGQGGHLYAMLPTLSGTLSGVVEQTVLKEPRFQEATELANLMQGKNRSSDVTLNCALGKLNLAQGIGTPEYLVADMKNVRLSGEGSIDLPQELLALIFYPQPKSAGFSEMSFPVRIKGSFADPQIKPDKTQAALTVGKMFVKPEKLAGIEALLGGKKKTTAGDKDLSGLHPCLTPIAAPADATTGATPTLKDAVDERRQDIKQDV